MCSTYFVLLQVTQHDHYRHILIHHHLPEVSNSVLHGTLGYDECLPFTIALSDRQWDHKHSHVEKVSNAQSEKGEGNEGPSTTHSSTAMHQDG